MEQKTTLATIVALLLIGTFSLHYLEDWSYVDSFYFSTITLTTVGYGDISPSKDSTKIFVSFYAMIGIGIMLYALGSIIGKNIVRHSGNVHRIFSNLYDFKSNPSIRNRRRFNRALAKDLIKRSVKKDIEKW